uniref:Phage capsid-like C-terminal domain-containing protein n=1 Tax=uncultured organism TaxID=155900 RepID=A0A7L9QBV6_9ZZZZ|nr:hypothetical protein [uncultured organism]
MATYAEMLLEKRANVWNEAQGLLERAATEGRELSVDEETSYAKMNEALDSLRNKADAIAKSEEDNKAIEASLRHIGAPRPSDAAPAADDELRKFLLGEKRSYDVTRPVGTRGIGTTKVERRALSEGTSAAGGYTVPTSFYGKLWQNMILTAQLIHAGATVLETASGEPLQIPATTSQSTAALVAEAAALTESDPVFSQPTLSAYKYGVLITVSRELVTDTAVDLEGFLAVQAGRAVGNAIGTHLVTGTGTSQPQGIVTGATLGVTGGTGQVGSPTFDELISLFHSVISPYRNSPSAAWFLNDLTAANIRKLKTSQGVYLWEPSMTIGEPDSIFGKPVYTDPNVAAAALNAKSVLFGDLGAYFVRIAGNLRFEQSLDYAFNTDQVVFRCLLRGDGRLVDTTGAVKYYLGAAS